VSLVVIGGTSSDRTGHAIAEWHRARHPGTAFVPPFSALAWLRGNDIWASAVFCNFTGPNVDLHLVIVRPCPQMVRDTYRYVFQELKCLRLTGKVPLSHTRLIRLALGLGFHIEGSLPHYYGPSPGDEAIVFGFYAEDARKVLNGRLAKHT
jgi:hypothetical protein